MLISAYYNIDPLVSHLTAGQVAKQGGELGGEFISGELDPDVFACSLHCTASGRKRVIRASFTCFGFCVGASSSIQEHSEVSKEILI